MIYKKMSTRMIRGRAPERTDCPSDRAVILPKLGNLSWTLKDGTVVVCRTYHEYKQVIE